MKKILSSVYHVLVFMVIGYGIGTIITLTSCTQKKATTEEPNDTTMTESEAFDAFAEHFSETASFAFAEISGRKVMLVSQETFGDNDTANLQAVEATIFVADSLGIICLGSVRSQGTLYPVSLIDGQVIVGGHQFIRIYGIRDDVPELELTSYAEGEGPELTELNQRFFNQSTPIRFHRR